MQKEILDSAYQYCINIAREHYENFPTASILLNSEQRQATAAIYAFARYADDIADEGHLDEDARLTELAAHQQKLDAVYQGHVPDDPIFIALADTINRYDLPRQTLVDLLTAFRMDVTKKHYRNFSELLEYCRYSANPIGELVLRVHGFYNQRNKHLSDCICSALQLINFIQDLDEDVQQRQRIYIPLDEIRQYGVSEDMIKNRIETDELGKLLGYQLDRAQNMLLDGIELVDSLTGKVKFIIALTISSGLKISDKIRVRKNYFTRPTLHKLDWLKIGLQAVYFRTIKARARIRQIP